MHPILLEVGDTVNDLRQIQVLYLPRLVTDRHFIETDPVGPHVNSRTDPDSSCHLRGLVILRTDQPFHVGSLLSWLHKMTKTEITYFSDGVLFAFTFFAWCPGVFLLEKDIVDFDIRVNHASLVHIPDALQDVVGPNRQLFILDRLIFLEHSSREVVRAVACILHEDAEVFIVLTAVESPDNVWVIHLRVDNQFSPRKGHSEVRTRNFLLLCCLKD